MNAVLTTFAAQVLGFIQRSSLDSPSVGSPPPVPVGTGFDALAVGLFRAQFVANRAYQAICRSREVVVERIRNWTDIPAVPARAFKEFELTALPPDQRRWVFHSSGTTGQTPSRHFHGSESMALYEASLKLGFQRHLLGAEAEACLLSLTPPPAQAPHSSLVHMLDVVIGCYGTRPESGFFGRVNAAGTWEVQSERLLPVLKAAADSAAPVTLLGTAFNFVHLLDELGSRNLRLALPPGSRVMETGGYKGRSRELPRAELHAELAGRLGLTSDRIITEYGMSELSSQAYEVWDSERGSRVFAFPPWARAQVVSPETGREVADGERGLLRIFDLANVWSVLAVQTEDLAVRRGTGFELRGRAAVSEARGCSLMVAEPSLGR